MGSLDPKLSSAIQEAASEVIEENSMIISHWWFIKLVQEPNRT